MPRYWLFKSEPDCFSYDDLEKAPNRTTGWDGIRNYQARNFLRDDVKFGDGVIYYHSNAEPPGMAGVAVIVEESHPDPTQFDPKADHFDPKSELVAPTWMQVGVRAVAKAVKEVSLAEMRAEKGLDGLELLKKGSRLSVHPVSHEHWQILMKMAGFKTDPHAKWLTENGLDSASGPPKKAKIAAVTKPAATKNSPKKPMTAKKSAK
jgi:predicted RNA-binding protein with PUA-like domain